MICHTEEEAERVKFYATQAREARPYYYHEVIGYNYRLSNVCAGIGCGQMDVLDEKSLSEEIYAVAESCGLEPKNLFTVVYQALIGKNQGPRLASFMKIIGKKRLEQILSLY